jgi:hypothetical protein
MAVLSGCGSNATQAICDEANSAMSVLTLDEIVPDNSADWVKIGSTYSGIKSKLQTLSSQAAELDESQLARDFASISKNAGKIAAVASFIQLVGGGPMYARDNVLRSEWLDAVNLLTDNEALRSPSDRTFIGCKSS